MHGSSFPPSFAPPPPSPCMHACTRPCTHHHHHPRLVPFLSTPPTLAWTPRASSSAHASTTPSSFAFLLSIPPLPRAPTRPLRSGSQEDWCFEIAIWCRLRVLVTWTWTCEARARLHLDVRRRKEEELEDAEVVQEEAGEVGGMAGRGGCGAKRRFRTHPWMRATPTTQTCGWNGE